MQRRHFTTDAADAPALAAALERRGLLVVGLCAAWCGTCKEFERSFETLAQSLPTATFVWTDVEDDADLVGDIDIENFPTLAIYWDDRLVYFGVSLPLTGVVARLLASFDATSPSLPSEPAAAGLRNALERRQSPSSAATN